MRYIISFLLASTALPALAQVPRVVTDLPAVHAITAQVMGDLGQPDLLLDKGGNAHNFQLRPSQARALSQADLVIWIGPEMTPWLDRALIGVTVGGEKLELLEAEGTFRRNFGDAAQHDHATGADHDPTAATDAGHAKDTHAEDAGHAHAGLDPHAWLDPANAQYWAGLIAGELSRLDPENATTYAANAAATQTRISAMDTEIAAILAPIHDKPFVVFHDAYGYFAGHYDLTVAGSISLGDATSPGAARLRELSDTIAAGGALCLFPESQHDPALVTQMATGSNARIGAALDPSGSLIVPGPDAYDTLMRKLASTIAACLNG
ncbi:MAG: zinc ABC transporter substrate-binding protein [Rhodobacteraceae bacterium]|nr:zinc ABC transporter substrate-binding protein [Paracoccaceae bacterium]